MSINSDPNRTGDLIAFQIGALENFSSTNLGRWGVVKILHLHGNGAVTVAVLDGLHDNCPSASDVRFRSVLVEKRFRGIPNTFQSDEPLFFTTMMTQILLLKPAVVIGNEYIPRPAEAKAFAKLKMTGSVGSWGAISAIVTALDHEDRALHDREKWLLEDLAHLEQQNEKAAIEQQRVVERLSRIKLDMLRKERLFPEWDKRSDPVFQKFATRVRSEADHLLESCSKLGLRPKRPEVRRLLLQFIDWLNDFDECSENMIETDERDDLMQFLEEVCWAIKQKALLEELDEHRHW